MNIEQVEKDYANKMIVSKETMLKLVAAALMMEEYMSGAEIHGCDSAKKILKNIKEM